MCRFFGKTDKKHCLFIDIKSYLTAKLNCFSLKKYIFIKLTLDQRGEKLSVLNYIGRKLFFL